MITNPDLLKSPEKKKAVLGEIGNGKKMCFTNLIMLQGWTFVPFWNGAMRKFPVIKEISGG